MLIRKLLMGPAYLLALSLLAFFMSTQAPGDPARIIANQNRDTEAPPELVEAVRREYGFDRSLPERYLLWLWRFVRYGDLGISTRTRLPVISEIASRLPATLALSAVTFLVVIAVSFPLGIYAGVTRNRIAGALIQGAMWVGASVPIFIAGNALIWLFAVKLDLLPAIGRDSWRGYVLPVLSLSMGFIGNLTHVIRAAVREVTYSPHIRTARAKGLRDGRILRDHVLRPALLPILTTLGLQFGNLIGGAFIVESMFAWDGIGRLLVDSILGRDFAMLQGIVLYLGGMFVALNFLIDLLYTLAAPSVSAQLEGRDA